MHLCACQAHTYANGLADLVRRASRSFLFYQIELLALLSQAKSAQVVRGCILYSSLRPWQLGIVIAGMTPHSRHDAQLSIAEVANCGRITSSPSFRHGAFQPESPIAWRIALRSPCHIPKDNFGLLERGACSVRPARGDTFAITTSSVIQQIEGPVKSTDLR